MRIVHVARRPMPPTTLADAGGMPQMILWLAQAQVARGHDVHILATRGNQGARTQIPITVVSNWGAKAVLESLPSGADVLHLHGEDHGLFSREAEIPVGAISTFHGNLNGRPDLINPVFVSQSHAQRHGEDTFVYNGLPCSDFEVGRGRRDGLLFLGKLRRSKKGAKTAVRVARRAGVDLTLAGHPTWKIPASRMPWWPGVRAVGAVSGLQKNDLLRSARALLCPVQWDEPFGLVLIEAMACGTPVIGTDRGALPEIIKHGQTGFICRTEEEMVEAIGAVDQLSPQACREHVERRFDIRRVCADYEELYRRAIAGERW